MKLILHLKGGIFQSFFVGFQLEIQNKLCDSKDKNFADNLKVEGSNQITFNGFEPLTFRLAAKYLSTAMGTISLL